MLDTVIDTVWLRLFVLWDFLISWIRLLIVFRCHPSRTLNYDFMLATLVTPRIINFRLAPASASLRLMRSLRIYYSMLWGALLQLTALYVWLSYTVLSQLCTFSSRILPSHSSVRSVIVYCPLTALYVLFSYTALSLLCMFGSRILSSHSSVRSLLVYCYISALRSLLAALYVRFLYTALSIVDVHRLICFGKIIKATDYQSFLVCL